MLSFGITLPDCDTPLEKLRFQLRWQHKKDETVLKIGTQQNFIFRRVSLKYPLFPRHTPRLTAEQGSARRCLPEHTCSAAMTAIESES